MILVVIMWILALLAVVIAWVADEQRCPVCRNPLDYDHIGFKGDRGYCHNCKYRTDDETHYMNGDDVLNDDFLDGGKK